MAPTELLIEHEFDLAPSIVWDALVDPELLAGWLADVEIEPEVGGRVELAWLGAPAEHTQAVIERIDEADVLRLRTDNAGVLEFRLVATPGGLTGDGPHGAGTVLQLRLSPAIERVFARRIEAIWRVRLDRLAQLLRGHPTDWSSLAGGGAPQRQAHPNPRRRTVH